MALQSENPAGGWPMTLRAIAWAVAQDGMIDTRTVTSSRRQSIVNWLYAERDAFVVDTDSDAKIEAQWVTHSHDGGARVIEVDVTWRPS
jgi:hypothetical protein